MSELYSRIDRLCKERGTNVTALCREAQVARSALSELKMGRTRTITLDTAAKLAAALGIAVDELMIGETEKEPISPTGDEPLDEFTLLYRNLTPEQKALVTQMMREMQQK